jgi:hypothetical protein
LKLPIIGLSVLVASSFAVASNQAPPPLFTPTSPSVEAINTYWAPIVALISLVFSCGIAWNQHKNHGASLIEHKGKIEAHSDRIARIESWRLDEVDDTLDDHEDRINVLEKRRV